MFLIIFFSLAPIPHATFFLLFSSSSCEFQLVLLTITYFYNSFWKLIHFKYTFFAMILSLSVSVSLSISLSEIYGIDYAKNWVIYLLNSQPHQSQKMRLAVQTPSFQFRILTTEVMVVACLISEVNL
jgi:hypothetical protein